MKSSVGKVEIKYAKNRKSLFLNRIGSVLKHQLKKKNIKKKILLIIIPSTPKSIHATVTYATLASVLNAEHLLGNTTITVQTSCILVA